MIFFYGWRTKRIGVSPVSHHSCSCCDTREAMFVETFRSYVHLFWIPLIPLMKSSGTFCGHCKQVLKKSEMPPDLRNTAKEIAKETKTPWYFFALPIATATVIAGLFITSIITHL